MNVARDWDTSSTCPESRCAFAFISQCSRTHKGIESARHRAVFSVGPKPPTELSEATMPESTGRCSCLRAGSRPEGVASSATCFAFVDTVVAHLTSSNCPRYANVLTCDGLQGNDSSTTGWRYRTILRGWRPTGHPSLVASGLVGCEPRTSDWDVAVKTIVDSRVVARGVDVDRTHSSRCSMPFFETLASVISLGIQSGLSSGAVSLHAHPS